MYWHTCATFISLAGVTVVVKALEYVHRVPGQFVHFPPPMLKTMLLCIHCIMCDN